MAKRKRRSSLGSPDSFHITKAENALRAGKTESCNRAYKKLGMALAHIESTDDKISKRALVDQANDLEDSLLKKCNNTVRRGRR